MRLLRLLIAFAFALHLIFPLVVYAHPGRTDSEGGHTDRSTEEYHYHHGYPEHDHYDMDGDGDADCPYDFDDKTGSSSNDSSNGFDADKFYKELEKLDQEKLEELEKELESWKTNSAKSSTQTEKPETFFDKIPGLIIGLLCLFGVCWIVEKIWKKIKK